MTGRPIGTQPYGLLVRLCHRVRTAGSVADVWSLLGEPRRWPTFDVALVRVVGASGPVMAGQRLVGITRGWPLRIPLDVVRVVAHRVVQVRIHPAPGVREEIEYRLVPVSSGGTQVSLTVDLDGPLARVATLATWGASGVSARLLARGAAQARRARLSAEGRP